MKPMTKHLALILALLMLLIPFCGILTSCGSPNEGNGSESTSGDGSNPDDPNAPIEYKVIVKSQGGRLLPNITVKVHTEENGYIVTDPIITDESGTAVFSLPRSDSYYVALGTVPDGYNYAARYQFIGSVCEITLSSAVIQEEVEYQTGMYELGSVVHDFSFKDIDGKKYVLSELLEKKTCVLLNFWYVDCTFCIKEFPLLDEAYLSYYDDVEVLALNNYGDSKADIEAFRDNQDLSIPMIYDTTSLMYSFITQSLIDSGKVGYPISVVIDRYGVVCMVEIGAILDDTGFSTIFEYFTADDEVYKQTLIKSPSDLIPKAIPDIDMPASNVIAEAFSKGEINVEFTPETSETLAEMSWPFIVVEKNGQKCIAPSNSKKSYSYATMHAKINLNKGDVVAFDYFAFTEAGTDYFSASVDGIEIRPVSGISTEWKTYYAYVADAAGTYDITFRYVKDSSTNVGDDTVYLKDLRIVSVDDINTAVYIPRQCATNPNAANDDYLNYAEIFLNEADGYYHVGSEDGPLLLANLLGYSLFKNGDRTAFEYVQSGDIILNGKDYTDILTQYANYASNSKLEYCCTVDQGLMECLIALATLKGITDNPETEWLQFCKYYDAYQTEQLQDPIQGLSFHSAFNAQLGADNAVEYDGRIMIPRGYLYRFTPEVSGAYRVISDSTSPVEAWVFTDTLEQPYYEFEPLERMYADPINCSMVLYMEAGKSYYINIAYYDYYEAGSFTFEIKFECETYQIFSYGSGAAFTSASEDDMSEHNLIAGGIDVVFDTTDGFYHQRYSDGSVNPTIIYADFSNYTPLFQKQTLYETIDMGGFDFRYSDTDVVIMKFIEDYGTGEELIEALREEWAGTYEDENGETVSRFEKSYEYYKVDEVIDGIYHGAGEDLTEWVRSYVDENIILFNEENPELNGCVPLTKELADALQMLIDKYSFKGVDHSWTKVCCYYRILGPDVPMN